MMLFKVYKTTNLANGKIYIGQTHYDNEKYLGSGVLILEAIKKYGIENFSKEYIDEAESQEELDIKEKYWIRQLNSQDKKIGYNIADGWWNFFTMNDEVKKKISNTLKGKYVGNDAYRKGISLSKEHKEALSKANKGKTLTKETKKKLSASHTGKTHSVESKKKMSDSKKGKKLSEDHKKHISESGLGRVFTQDQKNKLRESNVNKTQLHSRTIMATCIESNVELPFNNISSAARYFGVTRQRIKQNKVNGWMIVVNDPEIPIQLLKKTYYAIEGASNT